MITAAVPVRLLIIIVLSLFTLTFSITENEALLKLKDSFLSTGVLDSWVPHTNACKDKWAGVVCSKGAVSGINLRDMAIGGVIDVDALNEISGLRTIGFQNNSFSGRIPDFNKLGALKALFLSKNQFSGDISSEFFSRMTSMKKLWLDNNKFTGKIPDSVTKLPNLIELHLEGNQFSGPIPALKQTTAITSLDLSYNKLEGEIPESFSRFPADSFRANDKLCGKPLNNNCTTKVNHSSTPEGPGPLPSEQANSSGEVGTDEKSHKLVVAAVMLAFLIFFMVMFVLYARYKERDDFRVLEKEDLNDEMEPRVPGGESTMGKRGSKSSNRGGKSIGTDLVMINDEKGPFGSSDLMRAAAEVLGSSGLGSSYKAAVDNGLTVVVKRMGEMNRIGSRDDFHAEMERLGALKHPNILTPLAYHYRREDKLIISEYIPKGSLLYLLHGDRGIGHAELNWPTRLKIIKGIASGMGFIHSEFASYELPHGNLKSSNVLLNENYQPLLTDYAFHPLINRHIATQALFAYRTPEYIEKQQVCPKSDVYCVGIIILEILTGKLPSLYRNNGKTDVLDWARLAISQGREIDLIDPDIASTSSLGMMARLLQIGAACTESKPEHRPDIGEAIRKIEEVQV
ncbi:pollen receptor-like kinase 3 [Pistacia vera]|uniref:pollen receptor-like kinase 3 n=1 Tax=Pistacia vera TaxID=55513 RepID=UPI001263414E|nr:pollen receptor-like kinase 3 [Pistacia vera]